LTTNPRNKRAQSSAPNRSPWYAWASSC
jgi:hypothetical protein